MHTPPVPYARLFKKLLSCMALLAAFSNPLQPTHAQSSVFEVIDLDGYGPSELNDRGFAALREHAGRTFAGLWQDDRVRELSTPSTDHYSAALGINNRAQVVGYGPGVGCAGCATSVHAVLWEPDGTRMLLPHLAPTAMHGAANGSEAQAINDRGEIVGWSFGGMSGRGGWQRATLWRDGRVIELAPTVAGSSAAYGLNDLGDVVGWMQTDSPTGPSVQRAFLWSGTMRDLGSLAGPGGRSIAQEINDRRQVVGSSATADGGTHAFLWQDNKLTDLGTLDGDTDSEAFAINKHGHVVGRSFSRLCGPCVPRAALWIDGEATDLNSLLPANNGWVLNAAIDIDDSGRIIGRGTLNGQPRYFMVEPR